MTARDVATAAGCGGKPPQHLPKIRKFTSFRNQAGTVLGFLSIELASGG